MIFQTPQPTGIWVHDRIANWLDKVKNRVMLHKHLNMSTPVNSQTSNKMKKKDKSRMFFYCCSAALQMTIMLKDPYIYIQNYIKGDYAWDTKDNP